jgi:hypothetical protein
VSLSEHSWHFKGHRVFIFRIKCSMIVQNTGNYSLSDTVSLPQYYMRTSNVTVFYISLKAPILVHLISLSLISPTCFSALAHYRHGLHIFLLRNKICGFLLHFVYPNFTLCIYGFHRFTVGLPILTICSYPVIVE